MKEIFVNDLIQWSAQDETNTLTERVIWIDEGYTLAFLFNIYAKKGFPRAQLISQLKESLNSQEASKLELDPWLRIVQEDNLSNKDKKIRDKAWEIISSLVTCEPDIYYRHLRGKLVQKVITKYNEQSQENKLIEKTVYQYLRKFWQRGKIKNALLPDYINSGGKGKIREIKDDEHSEKQEIPKRGRPRKYKHHPKIGEGINITEKDKKNFRRGINEFYRSKKQNSLQTAYKLTMRKYYNESIEFDENNNKIVILIPPDQRPTFSQFYYWFKTEENDIEKTISSRKGSRHYHLNHRPITGNSKQETIGPGYRYQIDATVADVYLISKYHSNWIIGRPVIYVIIDVFTRMIVGTYVGLEGPSWIGAMMALANAASKKSPFCERFGIPMSEEEWPCHHIPKCVLGDRGELLGMTSDTMIANLGIRVENAAPYRADWKGLVERHFGLIHAHVKPFLPGYVDPHRRKIGGSDYRLDARLNLDDFTEIVINIIKHHNRHELQKYQRDADMIADDVPPIPIELWKWGIRNRSGHLKTFQEDFVKFSLMPKRKARITERGIRFNKLLYYTCETAQKEMWFTKARSQMFSKEETSLEVSYDPRQMDFIYFYSADKRTFEKCTLIDEDNYNNTSIYDVEYLLDQQELEKQTREGEQQQNEINLMGQIEDIATRAEKRQEKFQDDTESNSKRTSGIKKHRAEEKAKRREEEAFELESDLESSSTSKNKTPQQEQEETSSNNRVISNDLDLLEQKRRQQKHGKRNVSE
jgi:hypothetical protein